MSSFFKGMTSSPELIRAPLKNAAPRLPVIGLNADRRTLAKRRWRGRAADGREFGFELELPLQHDEVFFETATHCYAIAQTLEPVLRVDLLSPEMAARIAWQVGNLHFPVMIGDGFLLAEDDIALRHMFEREEINFVTASAVFRPLAGHAAHHHL